MSMSISLSVLVRLSSNLMNVNIDIVFFFSFRVHVGKLGQITNFNPIIGGDTAKHCIDQYMVCFATVH